MILKKLWQYKRFKMWYDQYPGWFTFGLILVPSSFSFTLFGHGLTFEWYKEKPVDIDSIIAAVEKGMPIGKIDSEEDLKKWADGDDSVLK